VKRLAYTDYVRSILALITLVFVLAAVAAAQGEVITTSTGLQYRDLTVGAGNPAVKGDTVQVRYTGWLYVEGKRGAKFDSTDGGKWNGTFKLGAAKVIPGWDEGIEGMRVGGRRELIIPPNLAYGPKEVGGIIPPNSTLDFEVELLKISK